MDCSPPVSSVLWNLQARILEWVAVPFSGDLPNLGIKLTSLWESCIVGRFSTDEQPGNSGQKASLGTSQGSQPVSH